MKYSLSILFTFLATSLYAQFDISAGMGMSYNNALVNGVYKSEDCPHASFTPAMQVSASYNTHRWQFGIETGLGYLSGRYRDEDIIAQFGFTDIHNGTNMLTYYGVNMQVYDFIYAPLLAFANVKADVGRVTVYGGVAGGGNIIVARGAGDRARIRAGNDLNIGGATGLQAGALVHLDKHFALNTTIAARKLTFSHGVYVVTMPATAGVTYSF